MAKQRKNILQIRKYLNGELDAAAMHRLERQAQDDPFLMEALEGYESANTDQQKNLDDLSARLLQRIEKKDARILPWRFISIAASVLLAVTIGTLWLLNREPEQKLRTAQAIRAIPEAKQNVDTSAAAQPQKVASATVTHAPFAGRPKKMTDTAYQMVAAADAVAENNSNMMSVEPPAESVRAAPAPVKNKQAAALNEVIATGYSAQKKALADSFKNSPYGYESADKALQGRAAGVQVATNTGSQFTGSKVVTGRVTDGEAGPPVIGAVVKVKGSKFGVVTDMNGKFLLNNVPNNASLNVSFIGYDPQEVRLAKRDSLVIAMTPSKQSLSEVVAVGYGSKKTDDADVEIIGAHPKEGFTALNKYLKEKAVLPDGSKGKVRLSFIVDGSGNLSDFKVIKSLNRDADNKAIALIEDGPDWVGASDRKPQMVKVTVNFHGPL